MRSASRPSAYPYITINTVMGQSSGPDWRTMLFAKSRRMFYFIGVGFEPLPQSRAQTIARAAMRKTSRHTYLIALALFLVGLACLLASGLRAGGAYFVTVSEALALTGSTPSAIKLFGVVTPGGPAAATGAPLAPPLENNALFFTMADLDHPEQTIAVRFAGSVPPLFKPGAEIIARGVYDPSRRALAAEELITKCPSKYEKRNRQDES